MSIPIRPDHGLVNRQLLLGSVSAIAAYALWPEPGDSWDAYVNCGIPALVATAGFAGGLMGMIRDYRLRRHLSMTEEVSNRHGSARQADYADICDREMDQPDSGNFLGLLEEKYPVFAPPKTPFSLIEMPPGTGKTICLVTGSILHKAKQGFSLCVADVKQELGPMLIPALQDMGVECWAVNPTGAYADLTGNVELSPYQSLLDAVYAEDDARMDAVKIAADYAALHLPERPDEKNPFFTQGSRRAIAVAILGLALSDPANCNPTGVFTLLNDPWKFTKWLGTIRNHLETSLKDDPVLAHAKGEAANLLHRAKHNEENFSSFLEGASQKFLSFSPGGRLANYGRTAIHNIADLRERQIALFIMTPLSHIREFSPLISLLNDNLLSACKRNPNGHKVHIVAEEALNYRFNDLASNLELMRGLGVSMDIYIQSFAGLVRQYGKDTAVAVESYADVKIYAGLNSFDRAKHVSDMLSEATIHKQDYNFKAQVGEIGVSSGELGRRLMTSGEIMSMKRGTAWAFVNGMPPLHLTLPHYGQISPWRDWVGDNPIEGAALRGETLFHIHYPEEGDSA